jgi:hypothetical protein
VAPVRLLVQSEALSNAIGDNGRWSGARLWEHGLHEDELLGSHLQALITFESILFLGLVSIASSEGLSP